MGIEAANIEASQTTKEVVAENQPAVGLALKEVYDSANPFQNKDRDFSKDTLNPAVSKEQVYLPKVVVSQDLEADIQAKKLKEEVETKLLEQAATEENFAILMADLEFLNKGKTEGNASFFDDVNGLRAQYGLPPLEYDSTLEDEAEDNNLGMAQRGTVGHFAHGGWEVANWIGGQGGSTELAARSLEGSSDHLNIILNRSITRMGAAAGPNWQTARFA